ncbi:MAG: filamentous hemagglutinin N-terminal domain-containing protein [Oleispira sp.]
MKNTHIKSFNAAVTYSVTFCMLFCPLTSMAAPVGGQVDSGNASINQSGLITTINQTSQHANINWNSFNVGENETVNFVQPNSNSSTLNQIHDANPSNILGSINANGRVFLSNSNGFIFGANSAVNVGSLFATTSQIDNLSDANLQLSSGGQGSIINQGNINTESGGYIAFFAPSIENTGTLNSPEGNVTLSNANSGLLYLPNSAGIGFTIDSLDSLNPIGIENTGTIKASGGQVLLSSAAIDTALRSAINNQGIIDVSAIHQDGGDIRILATGGSIDQAGILNANSVLNGDGGNIIMIAEKDMIHSGSSSARGGDESGDGGFVETSGFRDLNLNSLVDTRALNGDWGTWLIDPTTLNIGDGNASYESSDIESALNTNGFLEYMADTINVTGIILTSSVGTLKITATDLNINESIDTSSLDLNSTNIFLNANKNLTGSGEIIFKDNSNLTINGTSVIKIENSGALSLNGVIIQGSGGDDSLTLETVNGKIDLRQMNMTSDGLLNEFIITRDVDATVNANNENISISGNIYANTFTINNIETTKDQNIFLTDNTTINSGTINFINSTITGSNSDLSLNGTNTVVLDNVDGIASLTVATPNLTLTDDISTQGTGIILSGGIINLNKPNDILSITTYNTGNLTLSSSIDSAASNNSLHIEASDGAINLSAITDVTNLTINNSSSLTTLNGNIDLAGDFTTEASAITLNGNLTIEADGNIDFKNTEFTTSSADATIVITADTLGKTVKLGDFTAGTLSINSKALHLNGEISTSKTIAKSMDFSGSGAISLEDDSILNGNLYLGTAISAVAIDSLSTSDPKSLEINYDSQDLILGQVGAVTPLQSFTINGSGKLSLASTSTFSITTTGNEGISLLGSLTLDLLDVLTIDTSGNSGSGGDINLSGLNINGGFAVNLKAGSGNISLGTIGDSAAIASLVTLNTGNIELYGNINNVASIFDFSNASSVILNDDIIFGNSELYLTSLLFGDASINGNYDLTIFSSILTLGEVGQNIALQNLNVNSLDKSFVINSDINTAGNINISGDNLAISSKLVSTGGEINLSSLTGIAMSADAELSAADSDITLSAAEGDISIAALTALNSINITATTGSILNAIDDYTSNTSTSTNITAETINLTSGAKIGASIDSPIVINAGKEGSIKLSAGSKIYIANLENSSISSNNDIFDNSALTASANADILSQLKPETYNLTQFSQLEISDPIWQLDQLNHTFDSSNSSPRIYYSKKGWRLGNP